MKTSERNMIKRMIKTALFLILAIPVLAGTGMSELTKNEARLSVAVIPLNITADQKNTEMVQKAIPSFLLQRLNTGQVSAKTVLMAVSDDTDKIGTLYSNLKKGTVAPELKEEGGYICGGSVVVLGTSVVADFFLWDAVSGKTTLTESWTGNDIGAVLKAADLFTAKCLEAFSSGPGIETAVTESTEPVQQIVVNQPPKTVAKKKILKSDKISGEISAVAVCRTKENGKKIIACGLANRVVFFGLESDQITSEGEFKGKKHDTIIGLIAWDTDNDGADELIVSNLKADKHTIASYILRQGESGMEKIQTDLNRIFARSGDLLLTQKHKTMKSTLDSPIQQADFSNGELIVEDLPVGMPGWVRLPGILINNDSDLYYSGVFASDFRLRLLDRSGELFWESGDSYGGSALNLNIEAETDRYDSTRLWLPTPLFRQEVMVNTPYQEIITIKNDDMTKTLLQRVRSFKEGRIVVIQVSKLGGKEVLQTQAVSGHISGVDMVAIDDGPGVVYSVVAKGQSLFSSKKSYLVFQTLDSFESIR